MVSLEGNCPPDQFKTPPNVGELSSVEKYTENNHLDFPEEEPAPTPDLE
jgi:hypothetical protein